MKTIDFYFDFISPYAYFAATRIEALAARHGRVVQWRPFRLGVAVVKVMGLPALMDTPLKGAYVRRDVARVAKVLGVNIAPVVCLPDPVPAGRLFYARAPALDGALAKALLRALWDEGRDIADPDVLVAIGGKAGIAPATVREALEAPATRDALNTATGAAIARGVFGAPTCAVGDELFWGVDRLWLLEHYLEHGERYEAPRYELMGAAAAECELHVL